MKGKRGEKERGKGGGGGRDRLCEGWMRVVMVNDL